MDFGLSEEQQMIVDTTRTFVERELYPHEAMVERNNHLPLELIREIQQKAMAAGLYAANMPAEVGGAGLDTMSWLLYEKRTRPRQLRPALDLRGAALQHPAGRKRRTA